MSLDRVQTKLQKYLPAMVFLLFLIQPLMDVLSYWMEYLKLGNALTLVLRMGVLAGTVLVGFSVSNQKKIYYAAAGVLGALAVCHAAAALQTGYQSPFTDLTNYIRVIQMPITALCLISVIKANSKSYEAMCQGIFVNLLVILAVVALSRLTGTDPRTYADGAGALGWFNNTNSQCCILAVAVPVGVTTAIRRRGIKSWAFCLSFFGGMTALFFMGPRLALLAMTATGLGIAITMIICCSADWKRAAAILCVTVVFLGMIPFSPTVTHQKRYESVQSERQNTINKGLDFEQLPSLSEKGISKEELAERKAIWKPVLEPIYTKYANAFVEIFGLDQTMEIYDYSYDVRELTALRPRKIQYSRLLMRSSPESARWFGIELDKFVVGEDIYDVENDFHGIYFLYGIVGLGCMVLFLGYFVYLILWALFKDFKGYFTMEAAGWGIAFLLCLVHAYFTAAILRRPNASVYLSGILAAIYYLVRLKAHHTGSREEKKC